MSETKDALSAEVEKVVRWAEELTSCPLEANVLRALYPARPGERGAMSDRVCFSCTEDADFECLHCGADLCSDHAAMHWPCPEKEQAEEPK